MARSISSDFLMQFRFGVGVAAGAPSEEATTIFGSSSPDRTQLAGFSNVSVPEGTLAPIEYREGHFTYTQKVPGMPSLNDLTLSRGVTKRDTTFYDWWVKSAEGNGEYRADLLIYHYHRNDTLPTTSPPAQQAAIIYSVEDAWASKNKPSSDLDATSGEISVGEIDVIYEYFEVINAAPAVNI